MAAPIDSADAKRLHITQREWEAVDSIKRDAIANRPVKAQDWAAIKQMFESPNPYARATAALTCSFLTKDPNRPEALALLKAHVSASNDIERGASITSYGLLEGPGWVEICKQAQKDRSPKVRRTAASLLKHLASR